MEGPVCVCLKDNKLGEGCKHLQELGWDDKTLDALIAEYCPTLFLHPKEKYLPSSVDWYLARCSVVYLVNDQPVGEPVVPAGQLDIECLPEVRNKDKQRPVNADNSTGPLSLWLSSEHWPGQPKEELNDVPLYVRTKLIHGTTDGKPEALEITYISLWPYNGPHFLFGLPCFPAGVHVGDVEHLTVRLQLTPTPSEPATPPPSAHYTASLAGVWYNSHRNCEGEWTAAPAVPRDAETGRIAAYVAESGHGMYPKAETIFRIFCAANDVTSKKGLVWRPNTAVFMVGLGGACTCCLPGIPSRGVCTTVKQAGIEAANGKLKLTQVKAQATVVRDARPWQQFAGSWGTADAFWCQGWFNKPEPPVSRTFFERWCYPCAPEAV